MTAPLIYSVLNWGLGHATRSVPVINELKNMGYEVHLASSGDALTYLSAQFPDLPLLALPDYRINYPTTYMMLNAMAFAPSMLLAIRKEQKIIQSYSDKWDISIAFSDNRYGCFIRSGRNYFIGHQMDIEAGSMLSNSLVNYIQRRYLKQFQHVLVPDFRQMPNLAGTLSKGTITQEISYLGPLSSYTTPKQTAPKYDWCCILSGVEPQRRFLAEKLYYILEENEISAAIITGKPEPYINSGKYVEVFPLLNAEEVQAIVEKSKFLCIRSGYTSIMDLSVWRKPALLIPTPGQHEQIYLADYLKSEFGISICRQKELSIASFKTSPADVDTLPTYDPDSLRKELKKIA